MPVGTCAQTTAAAAGRPSPGGTTHAGSVRVRTRWGLSVLAAAVITASGAPLGAQERRLTADEILRMLSSGVTETRVIVLINSGCVVGGAGAEVQQLLRSTGEGVRRAAARGECAAEGASPPSSPTAAAAPDPTPRPSPAESATLGRIAGPHGMEFARIPSGSFRMGSSNGGDEGPQHIVTITRAFYLQTTEVTQAQWQAVMGSNPSSFASCGPTCPVEQVSWDDIQLFISTLNQRSPGVTYRLPTEAEWEYAARATTTTDFGGNNVLDDMGWWSGNSQGRTWPVAQKMPNAWGLYDMHGSTLEWVQDWYGPYGTGAVTDPMGPATGSDRVLRGGSWVTVAKLARSASRFYDAPSSRNYSFGFRLARTQ